MLLMLTKMVIMLVRSLKANSKSAVRGTGVLSNGLIKVSCVSKSATPLNKWYYKKKITLKTTKLRCFHSFSQFHQEME